MTGTAHSRVERFLKLFAIVEPREGPTSLLLLANIFLVLMAYYFIKPVREGWLSVSFIQGFTSLEVKAYSAFGQSLLLLAILPLYASLAAIWPRRVLITRVGSAFGALLIVFWLLQPGLLFGQLPFAGVAFYLFVGIFSVTLVAQFWSFAADLYGRDLGKRLFPLVAIGASAGAVVGSWAGEQLIRFESLRAFDLLLIALLPLIAAIVLTRISDRRGTTGARTETVDERRIEPAAPRLENPYRQILQHRYLMGAALIMLLFNWVVSSGDNILFGIVQNALRLEYGDTAVTDPREYARLIEKATTAFYGDLYFWVNLLGLFFQAVVVSRIVKFGGFSLLVLTTPLVSLAAYVSMAIAPVLGIIKVMKVLENSSNYSINNTARHMLWLPTTKGMLYQAKTTVDTLFQRLGDGLAALTVLVGTRLWPLEITGFLIINIVLVLAWALAAAYMAIEYGRLASGQRETQTA